MSIPNSSDMFIFNFPKTFVPEHIEKNYKKFLKNSHKPYASIIDYINSGINDITIPALVFPKVKQQNIYGKDKNFRGATSPYNLYNRDFNVNVKLADFNQNYFIIQDILLYHYINGVPYIDPFVITFLDEERRETFKVYLNEIIPSSLSDLHIGYNLKDINNQTFTVSFNFNDIDIEYIPKEVYKTGGEVIEKYSEIIIPNDTNIDSNSTIEDDEFIIGNK